MTERAADAVTSGGCLCGGIRFKITGGLEPIQVCHCGQCRKAQGGPFATNVPVPALALILERGAELLTEFESSPGKLRVFCRRCGSPIYSRRRSMPDVVRIRAGSLDGPLATRPAMHIHSGDAPEWWPIMDDLPQHPGTA